MDDTSADKPAAANNLHHNDINLRPFPARISVVIPFYNEAECIDLLLDTLLPVIRDLCSLPEVICVDDGSSDRTGIHLNDRCRDIPELRVIRLSRNFGQDAAITAGLSHASGQVVFIMDADLQHPPALLPDMLNAWRRGADMVCMIRKNRDNETPFVQVAKRIFYALMRHLTPYDMVQNAAHFRLLDRKACDALLSLTERSRYLSGLYQWIGFPSKYIQYTPDQRAAGSTKWLMLPMLNRAIRGIISFSSAPLRIWSFSGASIACLAFLYGLYIVVNTLI